MLRFRVVEAIAVERDILGVAIGRGLHVAPNLGNQVAIQIGTGRRGERIRVRGYFVLEIDSPFGFPSQGHEIFPWVALVDETSGFRAA